MAQVRVRHLDDAVIQMLKDRAQRDRTSVEAILRQVITAEAKRPKQELMAMLREHQRIMRETCGELSDSTPGIREERERIG